MLVKHKPPLVEKRQHISPIPNRENSDNPFKNGNNFRVKKSGFFFHWLKKNAVSAPFCAFKTNKKKTHTNYIRHISPQTRRSVKSARRRRMHGTSASRGATIEFLMSDVYVLRA